MSRVIEPSRRARRRGPEGLLVLKGVAVAVSVFVYALDGKRR